MQRAVTAMKAKGAVVISFDPPEIQMDQFRRLLDVDMRADLPQYLDAFAHTELGLDSVKDVVAFNLKDTLLHAPYGQGIFMRITKETAKDYFEQTMDEYDLDAFLSIDNYSARNAAAAHVPALGVPMGYDSMGQPKNLTFIAPSKKEQLLLELGAAFERLENVRQLPQLFQ